LNKLKLGSLFDGIGGFPLSAQRHGIEPVWASEIEPFPIKVTQHHFPNMKHLGDITQINGAEIEPVDIITFGSPCFPAGTLILTETGYTPIENESDTAQTVRTPCGEDSVKANLVGNGYAIRRLTPTECLRLQGFPDWWLDIEGASDTAKYKALGNSVAIPCVDFIMSRIAEVLRTK